MWKSAFNLLCYDLYYCSCILFLGDFTVGRLEQHRTSYFVEIWILRCEILTLILLVVPNQIHPFFFFSFETAYFTNVKSALKSDVHKYST